MKYPNCLLLLLLLGSQFTTPTPSAAAGFTIQIPQPAPAISVTNTLASHADPWHWRRGTNAPPSDWTTVDASALDATWSLAPGGFGYGDDGIQGEATRVHPGMAGVHTTLYIRQSIEITEALDADASLVLTVDYDDGFVAYLDGIECARRNVPGSPGSPVPNTATTGGVSHEASCCQSPNPPVTLNLGPVGNRLAPGVHVLALIGVNQSIDSSDFHLIPDLATVVTMPETNSAPLVTHGLYALTRTNDVLLEGSITLPQAARVTVDGDDAVLDAGGGTWFRGVTLQPGWNTFHVAAHDGFGAILTNFEQSIVYEIDALQVGGILAGATTWNDPATVIRVTGNVTVPAGSSLAVGPGTVVLLSANTSMTATGDGLIDSQGAEDQPVVFLPATTNDWGWLMADGTNSLLRLRHTEVVAGQLRIDHGGELFMEDSVLRDLPNPGREVIDADDGLNLTLRRVHMARFAEADSQDTPVLVEGCLMEGFLIDGMDIKADDAPLVIRRTTFRNADPNNANADAIDFGPGAGFVDQCLIHDFPDKGVSIGGAPGTIIRNSLIYRCGIGISAYSSTGLAFDHNTIVSCLNGILFRDNPASAIGVATNLIVWGNTTNLAILDDSSLALAFSDVEGAVPPGTGNISSDPLFMDPARDDYRLSPGSPALDAAADGGPIGVRLPIGGIPSGPAQLIALDPGDGLVRLFWSDTAENEDGFLVERSPDRATWHALGSAPSNATAFTDPQPLLPGPAYYRVRATNDVGVSRRSNPARSTPTTALSLAIARSAPDHIVLDVHTLAGRTHIIQSLPEFTAMPWSNWIAIPAAQSGSHRITNNASGASRFFRLLTP